MKLFIKLIILLPLSAIFEGYFEEGTNKNSIKNQNNPTSNIIENDSTSAFSKSDFSENLKLENEFKIKILVIQLLNSYDYSGYDFNPIIENINSQILILSFTSGIISDGSAALLYNLNRLVVILFNFFFYHS